MLENWQENGFGLYIHWPFCETKCPYCDFNSYASLDFDEEIWTTAYCDELRKYADKTDDRVLSSIYFGGGTPSLMSAGMIDKLLTTINTHWKTANDIEITLEANPSTVESLRFRDFKSAGINRVSLGVQALNDTDLAILGRKHSAKEALKAIEIVRNTFDRSSFDLIYARQNQSMEDWGAELRQAMEFQPSHISLYQLTIEPGTVFAKRLKGGHLLGLPSDDQGADMYELTQSLCELKGLHAYEVSNHAKPGEESIHNFIYWNSGDYIGIGPGAHGRLTIGGKRLATSTPLHPESWLNRHERETVEEISSSDQLIELLLMGLRTTSGLSLSRAESLGLETNDRFNNLLSDGLLALSGNRLTVMPKGRPILNAILREIMA